MQSDAQKFTNGNVKKVQNIQTEWSNAMKATETKASSNKKVEKNDQLTPSSPPVKTESIILIGSKGKTGTKGTSSTPKFKTNKVSTPGMKVEQNNSSMKNKSTDVRNEPSQPKKKGRPPKSNPAVEGAKDASSNDSVPNVNTTTPNKK